MYDLYPFQTLHFPPVIDPPLTLIRCNIHSRGYTQISNILCNQSTPFTPNARRWPRLFAVNDLQVRFRLTGLNIPLVLHTMPIFRRPSLDIDRADGLHSFFITFVGLGLPARQAQVVALANCDGLGRTTERARAG